MSGPAKHGGDDKARFKQQAAEYAVNFVRDGMVVGLGTGSTAIHATRRIAELLQSGKLRGIRGYATSRRVWAEAQGLHIPMMEEAMPDSIDLTIDGADEVDPSLNLIKGGGGALLREKIVAQASRRVIIVVDYSKLSAQLGSVSLLPVEVLSFGGRSQLRYLESLAARVSVRCQPDGSQFITDSGNMILDCDFGPIADSMELAGNLSGRAGIVEHGLFIGLATDVIVAGKEGIRHLESARTTWK